MTVTTAFLALSWGTSKGRDTYGYNIARLDAPSWVVVNPETKEWTERRAAKRYRSMGGGYDMTGTVVGDWLEERYQDRLLKIKHRISCHILGGGKRSQTVGLYGGTYFTAGEHSCGNEYVSLDGACGIRSMETIAEAIGVSLTAIVNRKGHTTGFMVTDYGNSEALQAALK